jgi:hypothetical protein
MAWQPIHTAPRDGTLIYLTWMDKGEPQEVYPMRWGPKAENALFPGVVGFWVLDGGEMTWTEHDPEGAPTHWRPVHAQ